jgi:dimethylhistidine N-methyltransferase
MNDVQAVSRATSTNGHRAERQEKLAEVQRGLSAPHKHLSPTWFYDERGSLLFDRICELEEYYPTRTEIRILEAYAGEMAASVGERCRVVELGSGSSTKTPRLLDALRDPAQYVPIDIASEHLTRAASAIRARYPRLDVAPLVADYTKSFVLPPLKKTALRTLAFFPGSTIGNFEPEDACLFLRRLRELCAPRAMILIGVDLKKDPAKLHAAYNDRLGVTAEFNLNALAHINRTLGTEIPLEAFRHYALYNPRWGRIEMHLVSTRDQVLDIGGCPVVLDDGESIETEHSYKYTLSEFERLAAEANLRVERVWTDDDAQFSVQLLVAG